MKPEDQLIALLEYMGWKGPYSQRWLYGFEKEGGDLWAFAGTNPEGEDAPVPELTLDLMHEAEKALSDKHWTEYGYNLESMCLGSPMMLTQHDLATVAHASKEQRLEAFLKTVGKWREKT